MRLLPPAEKTGSLWSDQQNRFLPSCKRCIGSGIRRTGHTLQGDADDQMVSLTGILQQRCLARHLGIGWGRRFYEPGHSFIDLLLSDMGPVKWLQARCKTAAHRIAVEDIGMVLVEFASGAYGVIQLRKLFIPGCQRDWRPRHPWIRRIEGERLAFLQIEGQPPQKDPEVAVGGASDPKAIDATLFVHQYRDFISAIDEGRDPVVSGTVARRPLQLILAIYESARCGKAIEMEKFAPAV